jgi:protein SCO1
LTRVNARSIAWIVVTLMVLGSIGLMMAQRMQQATARQSLEQRGYLQFDRAQDAGDIPVRDVNGMPARERLYGHWSILFFGFSRCPDVCPTTLSVLNLALAGLVDAPTVVMISVDPGDTPAGLDQYVRGFNPDFVAMTGTPSEIEGLTERWGIAYMDDQQGGIEHSALLVVLDPQNRHLGYLRPPHHPENIREVVVSALLPR